MSTRKTSVVDEIKKMESDEKEITDNELSTPVISPVDKELKQKKEEDEEEEEDNEENKEKQIEEENDNNDKLEVEEEVIEEQEQEHDLENEEEENIEENENVKETVELETSKIRINQIRGRKSIKDITIKDTTNQETKPEINKTTEDIEKSTDSNDCKKIKAIISPIKDTKTSKDIINEDEVSEPIKDKNIETTPDIQTDATSVTRLTRKTASQELLSSTRITRNRNGRPETPPETNSNLNASTSLLARTRRSFGTRKNLTADLVKRKRSAEETNADATNKHIKLEVKDEIDEEDMETDVDISKIKLELPESDETSSSVVTVTAARGRPKGRKSQTPTITVSPSTRTTRHTKLTSQSPTPSTTNESKRRRNIPASTRNSVGLSKSNQNKQAPDEDSKDSMQSSLDEVSLTSEVRLEKMSDAETEIDTEEKKTEMVEPLTVDTAVTASTSNVPSVSSGDSEKGDSEKAVSLSPELVSEGVNVISVKQFYKKPEFLENNLGIEEDPKLGEIVVEIVNKEESTSCNGSVKKYVPLTVESSTETAAATHDMAPEKQMVDVNDVFVEPEEDEEDGECCERLIIEEDDENKSDSTEDLNEDTLNKKTKIVCDNTEMMEKKRTRKSTTGTLCKKLKKEQTTEETNEMLKALDIDLKKFKKQISPVEDNKENITEIEQMDLDEENTVKNLETQEDYKTEEEKPTIVENVKSSQSECSTTSPEKTEDDKSVGDKDEETFRQKEQHLQNLGLLTHKAAQKRRMEYKESAAAAALESATNLDTANTHRNSGKRNGKHTVTASVSNAGEYTGTLKTVIKLNRSSGATGAASTSNGTGRKHQLHHNTKESISCSSGNVRRQPLKMTFQKGRGRNISSFDRSNDSHAHDEDSYYTIQNENEGGLQNNLNIHTHGRKTNNRANHTLNTGNTNHTFNTKTNNTKKGVCVCIYKQMNNNKSY